MQWGALLAETCTTLRQPPEVVYQMAWTDWLDLWAFWHPAPRAPEPSTAAELDAFMARVNGG